MDKINMDDLNLYQTTENNSTTKYKCSVCADTGWLMTEGGVVPCSCRIEETRMRKISACGIPSALAKKTFNSFDFIYYAEFLRDENGETYRARAKKVFDICRNLADSFSPDKDIRGIVLQGDVGIGKTHLAAAVCNRLIERGFTPYFMVVPEFLDEIRASYSNNGEFNEAKIMERAMQAQFLVLDDLGSHNFTEWAVNKLFTLLNYRVNHGLPFMITTNLSIKELRELLGNRIISRITEVCDFRNLQAEKDIRRIININHMGENRD